MSFKLDDMQTMYEIAKRYRNPILLIDRSAMTGYFSTNPEQRIQHRKLNLKYLKPYEIRTTNQIAKKMSDNFNITYLNKTVDDSWAKKCLSEITFFKRRSVDFTSEENYAKISQQCSSLFNQFNLNQTDTDFLISALMIAEQTRCVVLSNNLRLFRAIKTLKMNYNIKEYLQFYVRMGNNYFNRLWIGQGRDKHRAKLERKVGKL